MENFIDKINEIEDVDFLTKEFLIWLWYNIELRQGEFLTTDNVTLFISIENKIVLQDLISGDELLIKTEFPSQSLEAHYALKMGKLVKELKIRMVKGTVKNLDDVQHEWMFNFKPDGFKISALKTPNPSSKKFYDSFKERMFFLEEFNDYLNDIFKQFLEIRLDDTLWKNSLDGIMSWIKKEA